MHCSMQFNSGFWSVLYDRGCECSVWADVYGQMCMGRCIWADVYGQRDTYQKLLNFSPYSPKFSA